MKKIILFFCLLFELYLTAQTPEFNLQKYWFYRERFKQFFVSIGKDPGQSLAVAMMVGKPDCQSNLVNNNPLTFDNDEHTFRLDDLTGHQGWYISVLATEYALLRRIGANTDELVHELYCALYALNRLDMTGYLNADGVDEIGNDELDGFMIREDFPRTFFSDHPEVMAPDDQDIQDRWNVNRCTNHGGYTNDCFHALGESNEEIRKANFFGRQNEMAASMDHYSKILMGLALVVKFVDEYEHSITFTDGQGTVNSFQDGEFFIRKEAQNIADRIVSYLKKNDWLLMMPDIVKATENIDPEYLASNCCDLSNYWGSFPEPCRNCPAQPMTVPGGIPFFGVIAPRGCNASWFSMAFAKAGGAIRAEFDLFNHPLKYLHYDNITSIGSDPAWQLLGTNTGVHIGEEVHNKAGTVAYMFILAAIGDSWAHTQESITINDAIDYKWGIYQMLHTALWDRPLTPVPSALEYALERMNTAPCKGIDRAYPVHWNDNNAFEVDSYTAQGSGDNEVKCNGLDYMLLFNLYVLTHPTYVDYNEFFIGDKFFSGNIPRLVLSPTCPPVFMTAIGASSTGTPLINPKPKKFFCIGNITTTEIMAPVNFSGDYTVLHACYDGNIFTDDVFTIDLSVINAADAVVSVTYTATDQIYFDPPFNSDLCQDCEFKTIEFKCNAEGTAYERRANPNQSDSTSSTQTSVFTKPKAVSFLQVKPNPNEGLFEVAYVSTNTAPETAVNLLVMDLFGKEIWRQSSTNQTQNYTWSINLPSISQGVYLLKIIENGVEKETKQLFLK